MYIIVETRIDITFATLIMSCFLKNPRPKYFNTVNQILNYLAKSKDLEIMFKKELKLLLLGYFESDQAKNHTNRISIFRFIFILNRRPISYSLKKAMMVLSSIKA